MIGLWSTAMERYSKHPQMLDLVEVLVWINSFLFEAQNQGFHHKHTDDGESFFTTF